MNKLLFGPVRDGIFTVAIVGPPINGLDAPLRAELMEAIEWARDNSRVSAILLRLAGSVWSASADIRDFNAVSQEPTLPNLLLAIEQFEKPVVAAIGGTALGEGLELALACHLRVAASNASFGFPDVKLGLMPGGGGTQRLPRLTGIANALDIMVNGEPIGADRALAIGLVDAVVPRDELEEHARQLVAVRPKRSTLALPVAAAAAIDAEADVFFAANKHRFKGASAAPCIIEVVREGLKQPARDGLALERAGFEALRHGEQSGALRYSFFSDRVAAEIPGLDMRSGRPIARVGIIGAGTMGSGIALCFLQAGLHVTLVERGGAALDRGVNIIRSTLRNNAENGRMTAAAVARAEQALCLSLSMDALAEVDLVVEAAFEAMDIKKDIFRALDQIARPGAILASNTSYLDIDAMALVTRRPADVIGLHFFSPANVMKLLEIVKGRETADDVLATAFVLAGKIGKTPVLAGNTRGFIGNRMLAVRQIQADALLLDGVSPYDIDRVLEEFGLPMGPFRMKDLAGLDIGWSAETSRGKTIVERLCEAGRRGQKTGAGFYDYDEKRRASRSPLVEAMVAELIPESRLALRYFDGKQILDRLVLPMVNEGVRLLAERKALRGSDIDAVWRNGYGWPRWSGGPLYWADRQGLGNIIGRLEKLACAVPALAPVALLKELAVQARNLADYVNNGLDS